MLGVAPRAERGRCPLLAQAMAETWARRPLSAAAAADGAPPPPPPPPELGAVVAAVHKSFSIAPAATALGILGGLSELDRVHLLLALQATTARRALATADAEFVDEMVKLRAASGGPHAGLTRGQIANAVAYQRMLARLGSASHKPPSARQLGAVALAAGLPFVAFGATDNLVLLLAGESIDALFGARLGITTLASAALGNIVADVVGVSATQGIKERSRRIAWAQPPRLSALQQAMASVRRARLGGAALGVTLGCVIGTLPLFVLPPGFWDSERAGREAAVAAVAAAAGRA
jgi:hypothetical protein